jgi:succinyl-diaminopimelate desuccinylase
VVVRISGEAFFTGPGSLASLVSDAVHAVIGRAPALSTSGGTSDARFIRRLCPVVEYGLPGGSMHKLDECVAVADLHALADVYDGVLRRYYE